LLIVLSKSYDKSVCAQTSIELLASFEFALKNTLAYRRLFKRLKKGQNAFVINNPKRNAEI